MILPQSVLEIKGLLNTQQLQAIDSLFEKIPFEDGKKTASGAAREAKDNLQASATDNTHRRQVQEIVFTAIASNPKIQSEVMPKNMLPPIISKYSHGMQYGWHTDSPVMTIEYTIRVDLSITVFLSEPDTYKGGELEIEMPTGNVLYKLNKGDAVIYPTTKLHRVCPVTEGERVACVTWIQSLVKDTGQREILAQLKSIQESIAEKDLNSPENLAILQVYSNLMRMWTDM